MEITIKDHDKIRCRSAQDTYEIMRKVFFERHDEVDIMKEHFWTIALDMAFKILTIELVSMGSKRTTVAEPGESFRIPLYKSCSRLILVHNHPSNNLKPSENDINNTNRLLKAGLILDIEVVDHVIITQNSYYSFADNGIIERLKWDKEYALTFIHEKQVEKKMQAMEKQAEQEKKQVAKESEQKGKLEGRKEGILIGEKKGKKEERMALAEQMLEKGFDSNVIKELTGISAQWLGRLKNELRTD